MSPSTRLLFIASLLCAWSCKPTLPPLAPGDDSSGWGPPLPDRVLPKTACPDGKVEAAQLAAGDDAFVFWSERVQKTMHKHWTPEKAMNAEWRRGGEFTCDQLYTRVLVQMDSDGGVTHVEVECSSGLEPLDEETRAAFQRAAPLPAPPPGHLQVDGGFEFTFGFCLNCAGHAGLRTFRGSTSLKDVGAYP